ncbi:putative ABC transporter permease [Bifidobacterium simiarum]|uniref:Transporter n=1 Tax=Bifidobacterium simiarum TaxID=2045441 RepID=A0A2M9HFM2_9BIFI|nr:putative ABC transporter permease [Bifidobacterium simiarum]PJM75630.1 hypothetical protein CSQ87_04200 [Bifidobacterium simiarum]
MLVTVEEYWLCWLAYAFAGWFWETMLSVVLRKRFEDRGVLNGPLCPIYGFGGLLVVMLLADVNDPLALFLSSGVLACTLEYLSSWAIERLFHVRLWDYTGKPFNINGRVYLNGFIAFGAGATAIKLVIQPWMIGIMDSWPPTVLHWASGVLLAATVADAAVTCAGLYSFDTRLARVAADIRELKLEQIADIDERIDLANERLALADERLREVLSWQQRRLIRVFPSMVSVRDDRVAERVRSLLEKARSKRSR